MLAIGQPWPGRRRPRPASWPGSAGRRPAASRCCSRRPARAAPRLGLALTLLVVHALVVPSPLAVAAASVMKADLRTMAFVAVPAAGIAVALVWLLVAHGDPTRGALSVAWLAIAIPIALLILQSVAQMPSEPLGKAARASSTPASAGR